jgi:hypothetical protein
LPYVAAVGGDSIMGVGNSPSYNYTYPAMANSKTAVVSQAGMDGGNGGWAVVYGSDPITPTGGTLKLAIDEDQAYDAERAHTTEQVAYFIIDPPLQAVAEPVESLDLGRSGLVPVFDRFPSVHFQAPWLFRGRSETGQRTSTSAAKNEWQTPGDAYVRAVPALAAPVRYSAARLRAVDEFFAARREEDELLEDGLLEVLL